VLFADADAWTMVAVTREQIRTPDIGTAAIKAPAEVAAAAGL
jgi:hypothetical protein